METCPRCDSDLESITLEGRTAVYCDRCGYADVPVDHHGEKEERESWEAAINRFYDKYS